MSYCTIRRIVSKLVSIQVTKHTKWLSNNGKTANYIFTILFYSISSATKVRKKWTSTSVHQSLLGSASVSVCRSCICSEILSFGIYSHCSCRRIWVHEVHASADGDRDLSDSGIVSNTGHRHMVGRCSRHVLVECASYDRC
jgi:hypothetical protein